YKGKMYDLWNIGDKKGTVRFVEFAEIFQDVEQAGFEAVHDHVVFDNGHETVIMRENWRIAISQLDANSYAVDIRSTLAPTTDADVVLKEYRYAGLGFRATPEWTNKNSVVLTSTGKTRADADGSLERWTIMSGQLGDGKGGVLFLSHPNNYNFPEPGSEEHTSELQSRENLVCRLLLEKKKNFYIGQITYNFDYILI